MVRVAREGQAKPHSRNPRALERPKTKGGSPREEQPCPQGPGLIQQDKSSSLSVNPPSAEVHSCQGGNPGKPEAGPYLMELSDETSRSDSSVSLGGGGGSLSGTAVKAGDFLEKNTSCYLGAGRSPEEAGIPLS